MESTRLRERKVRFMKEINCSGCYRDSKEVTCICKDCRLSCSYCVEERCLAVSLFDLVKRANIRAIMHDDSGTIEEIRIFMAKTEPGSTENAFKS